MDVSTVGVRAGRAIAATADQLATQAAMAAFTRGGNAVDAALAANAALAVTAPHLCGMGGDLFAIVRRPDGEVCGLNASGRAGAGADAAALRADGFREMPLRHDVRAVTVPGCVDGWAALHERFGSLPLDTVFAPAVALAARGFPASPLLVATIDLLDVAGREALAELVNQATAPGQVVRRPGVALTLQAVAQGGRDAFYDGAFGEGLIELGDGWFTDTDLERRQADWVDVLRTKLFGVELCTMGPNSQGYLTLGITAMAERAGLPPDPADADWVHVLVEAAKLASSDRPAVLHEGADGAALLDAIVGRTGQLDRRRATPWPIPVTPGDTTYLCTADEEGWAVSLIQSNAAGFGSWIVEPTTGINLHNRGLGFALEPGHPAELAPGRRPPHTLSPALGVRDGRLVAVLGTMGGDAQPQIVAQLAARLLAHREGVAEAVAAPRWVLRGPATGFDTWTSGRPPTVVLEDGVPDDWADALTARGHDVAVAPRLDAGFGHAHVIVAEDNGTFTAAADPRARVGSAAGV
jgi:gamma-glutamyltranspeptidase/glutathione hydrolase